MKISWVFWWIFNGFWVLLFLTSSIIIWLRKVDGAGVVQTPTLKLFSFAILIIAFIIPLIIQGIWFLINVIIAKHIEKNKHTLTI